MSNRPRRNATTPERPLTKRQVAHRSREAQVQRNVLLAIGGAVLLALVLIAAGVIYDRLVVPGRTIKTVNGQTLSRGDYDRIARQAAIQQLAQNLQFARILGPNASFGQDQTGSFQQQVVQSNSDLIELGSVRGQQQPVTDAVVDRWVDSRIVEAGAKAQFQIEPSQGEVDQVLVERMGSLLAEPAPLTSTTSLTPTPGISTTVTADGTITAGTTVEPATTSAAEVTTAITPTTGPTSTPAPTGTPTPSPEPAVASTKADQIVDILYDEYTAILEEIPEGGTSAIRTPQASKAEIAEALRTQYRDELIQTRVKQQLVPTVQADDATEPEQIQARHILLKVPEPEPTPSPTPTGAAVDPAATAEATAGPEVSPTPEPSPTATLEPAALDALFAERKPEADALYEQVTANPDDFADVARENSEDEGSAVQGGDLGSFGRGQMVKAFEDTAFALKENEISPPVRSEFGWHIIQRLPEDPKAKLERQQTAAYDTWLSDLRSKATVVPAPTATPTPEPTPTQAPLDATTEAAPLPEGTVEAVPLEPDATVPSEESVPETTAAP